MGSYAKTSMEIKGDGSDVCLLGERDDEEPTKYTPRKFYGTLSVIIFAAFIGGLAASTIWAISWNLRSCPATALELGDEPSASQLLHCGNSPAEARSLGCKLQTWSYTWVPEPCFDPELSGEFITIHKKDDLPYYADRNGTQVVDFDTVYEGEVEVLYTVWGSHYWHCAFLMRKFFRARATFTTASWDYEHVEHCQMWLADPFHYEWRKVNTKAVLVYATCNANGFWGSWQGNFETIE